MFQLGPNTALLVIDVQEGFRDPAWGSRSNEEAEANIADLLSAFRRLRLPVLHVRHDSQSPLGHFRPDTDGNRPMRCALELPGEAVYHKRVNSAFIGTSLETDLIAHDIRTLVVVGLTTNHCVSTTVRMAANLGFTTFVVSNATAAFARPALDGSIRSAEDVHAAALSDLSDEFAHVVSTDEVLSLVPGVSAAA